MIFPDKVILPTHCIMEQWIIPTLLELYSWGFRILVLEEETRLQNSLQTKKVCVWLCLAGGQEKGQRVAAASYLKNFLRAHWSEENAMLPEERLEFRNQLLEVLLRVDGLVVKLLAEAVSISQNL